ncbi:MAG: glycosyltransferase [Candidatus Asgardarchaeia archaeon]
MSLVEPLGKNKLSDYTEIIGKDEIESIKSLADKLNGASVIHVNSTSFGGGVAEILHRMIPLMRDVGLKANWKVIKGDLDFFTVTKTVFHNGLQGDDVKFSDKDKEIYLHYNKVNASDLDLDADFVVIHDPQPLAIIDYYQRRDDSKWAWRCHIDLSSPNLIVWNFVSNYIKKYDGVIFTMQEYVKKGISVKKIAIIPPSIDPLSDKNKPLPEDKINSILEKYDVDPERPIISQVGRFDPWKDPLGVIDTYRMVKEKIPETQLLLITSMAYDDPEGWYWYEKTARYAGNDYDIHLLTNLIGVGNIEVNAFQRATNVSMLKSIREGFGLVVSESLWKGVPVVGSRVGGIPLQIVDGMNGFLVDSIKMAAEKIIYLLKHPETAKQMGLNGIQHVRKNFLITRHLKDYLEFFIKLNGMKDNK